MSNHIIYIKKNIFSYIILLLLLLSLSVIMLNLTACGFHLRGTHKPNAIKIKELVLLPHDPYNHFYQTMREHFKRSGVDIALPQADFVCPTLTISLSKLTQHPLIYSLQGQTRREALQLSLQYILTLPNKTDKFEQKIQSNREHQLNPNQDLADQYEKTLLEKEMQEELVIQLIQQLSFLPLTESYRCVSISTNSTP